METKTFRPLFCNLTNEELLKYGHELAGKVQDIGEAESAKKASADHWKDEITRLETELKILQRKVSTRQEERSVECTWLYHWETGLKELARLDTPDIQIVEKGTITDAERQMHTDELEELEKLEPPIPEV